MVCEGYCNTEVHFGRQGKSLSSDLKHPKALFERKEWEER